MTGPKIEIASSEFKALKGVSSKGKAYDMAMQEAYLHSSGKYPDKFEIQCQKDGNGNWVPYQPGFYVPTPDSYTVRDGRLGIDSYVLQLVARPVSAAERSKAA